MDQNHNYELTCKRYLLGELTETEQAQFEEAYFVDDLLFQRFLTVKDDLIDSYARQELPVRERERFEQHFLATEPRRERVKAAREFIGAVSALPSQTPKTTAAKPPRYSGASAWQSFLRLPGPSRLVTQGALAVLLLLAVAGSLFVIRRIQRDHAEQLQKESTARHQQELNNGSAAGPAPTSGTNVGGQRDSVENSQSNPTASPAPTSPINKQSQPEAVQVAALSLVPFSPRETGSKPVSLNLGPETRVVRLSLVFKDDDYGSYEVTMRTVAGEQVIHQQGLKAQANAVGKRVTLTFNPTVFQGQDYLITLSGRTSNGTLEPINDYYLKVERSH